MSDDNIIRPDFGAPTPVDDSRPNLGMRRKSTPKRGCTHPQVEIDESNHDVTCIACDAFVSPTMILLRLARQEDLLFAARGEARRRHEELAKIDKRLKNMRGALAQARRLLRESLSEIEARLLADSIRKLTEET